LGLVFRGVSALATAIADKQFPGRGWTIFFGTISVIAGVVVLAFPFDSTPALALVVGIWLIVLSVTGSRFWLRHAQRCEKDRELQDRRRPVARRCALSRPPPWCATGS
jgi:uncharacterized membrane protein HdeD (DUF308 family)